MQIPPKSFCSQSHFLQGEGPETDAKGETFMQSIYEKHGGTYHLESDYLLPDFTPPPPPNIGVWGERRRQFLLKNKNALFTAMLLSGKLNAHLEEIDRQAREMLDRLISQTAASEGVTEALKARDQIAWVGAMNNIRARAEEAVNADLIYA